MSDEQAAVRPPSRVRSIVETIASISLIVAAIAVTFTSVSNYLGQRQAAAAAAKEAEMPPPKEPQSLDGAAVIGRKDARVALIQYSDFECPFCAKFSRETWPALKAAYVDTGKVKMAFKHLPLPMHAQAKPAAVAAECAARQGRFWEMHDRLFENPSELGETKFVSAASTLGLDRAIFDTCRAGQTTDKVARDMAEAGKLKITGTPTFLIGRVQPDGNVVVARVLTGALPVATFEAALNDVLEASEP